MFRNKIKLFVELSSFRSSIVGNRFVINLTEPLRDVVNVSVKQIVIPFAASIEFYSVIYFKSDLVALSRSMNMITPNPSNNTSDLILAMVPRILNGLAASNFYYQSDYPDKRTQNRTNISSFWFELYTDGFNVLPINILPNNPTWKISIELEISQANEQFLGDRLL